MKENSIRIIIILMTVSVLGLIATQLYWINNAFKIEEEGFNKSVGNALTNVVKLIDKRETADIMVRTINASGGHLVFVSESDSVHNVKISPSSNRSIIRKKVSVTGNGLIYDIEVSDTSEVGNKERSYKFITKTNSVDTARVLWANKVDSLISKKTKIIENVFEELITTGQEPDIRKRIKKRTLDSLIVEELDKYGIKTNYYFGVRDEKKDTLLFVNNGAIEKELISTQYKARMFPDEIFSSPKYLLLSFPNKGEYILKSIWTVLSISVFLIILIIFLFYQSLSMLIKQKKVTEVKNDLLNNITHELKTPLSTISLAVDIMNEPELNNSTVKNYTDIIKTETNRLTEMVENVLNNASLEKGEYNFRKENVDIHQVIDKVVNNFDLILNKKNGHINMEFNALYSIVFGDSILLANMFNNLIDNSIKYNVNNPSIVITTKNSGEYIEIKIIDNGIGMSKKDQKKIFDTFYRVPTGNIHNVKGNGIGLSSVRKIIDVHNGQINVTSKIESGSIFNILLPHVK